jgi:ADP-ribose pyrophosphatase YjhB (NUDIX family)
MGGDNIEVMARGVCVMRGQLLLCRTMKAKITYLPGGHVEFHEPARESLRREIAEELGLKSRVGRFLGAVEHTYTRKGMRSCEVNLCFRVDIQGLKAGVQPPSAEDHLSFEWTPLRDLEQCDLEPHVLKSMLKVWMRSARVERWASTH